MEFIFTRLLKSFLGQGDHVRLWTDDYTPRVVTSGLISGLRRELPRIERGRFHAAHYPDHRDVLDKVPLLKFLFEEARQRHISTLAIVDNSYKNINKAAKVVQESGQDLSIKLILVDHNTPQTYISPAFELGNISHRIIGHVSNLQGMREELLASSKTDTQLSDAKILWAFDFNETLMDTQSLEQSIHKGIAKVLHKSSADDQNTS